jgi:phenylacetate-CoA ligase
LLFGEFLASAGVHDPPWNFAALEAGAGMFLFLKQVPAAERLIKRNPFFYSEFRRALERMEGADLDTRRATADRLRARVVRWAARLPGYRDYNFARPFAEWPLLSKARLQNEAAGFQRRTLIPQVDVATSGTTGQPLRLKRSIQSLAIEQAMFDWMAAKVGLDYGNSRIAVLRGDEVKDPNDPDPPYWVDAGRNKVIFSSVHLNSRTFPHYERKLQEFQPEILTCYPSSLELLTHLAEPRNSSISFKLCITSSETLGADLRARVKRVFDAPLLDYYGQTERSCAAYSLEDGVYRFIFPYAYPELIPGADGKCGIVGTPFWNRAQPLLRYDIGDIAVLPAAAAEDAAARERISLGLSTFEGIEGRRSDCLKLADGSRVFGLDRVPSGVDGAASVQIVQLAPATVLMVVVPNAQYSEETLVALKRKFYLKVPQNVDLRIELRESPYRLASGKAPVFISQVQETAC